MKDNDIAHSASRQIRTIKKTLDKTSRLMFYLTPSQNSRVIAGFSTGLLSYAIIDFANRLKKDDSSTSRQSIQLQEYRELLTNKALRLDIIGQNPLLSTNIRLYGDEGLMLDDIEQQYNNAEAAILLIVKELSIADKNSASKRLKDIWIDSLEDITETQKEEVIPDREPTLLHGDISASGRGIEDKARIIVLVALLVLAVIFIALATINNKKREEDIESIRQAAYTTCQASADNVINNLFGYDIDKQGINYKEASDKEKIALKAFARGSFKNDGSLIGPYSERDKPCEKIDENEPKSIKGFMSTIIEKGTDASTVLSDDKSSLNSAGKKLFLESLSSSYSREIKEQEAEDQRIEANTKKIVEEFKRKYTITP